MRNELGEKISGIALLGLFPPFLQLALAESDEFCHSMGIKLDGTVSLNFGEIKFARSKFFSAIRLLYESADQATTLSDLEGNSWIFKCSENEGARDSLVLSSGERVIFTPGFEVLHHDQGRRLQKFEFDLADAGLPTTGFQEWREILNVRSFNDVELQHYCEALLRTPVAIARLFDQELSDADLTAATMIPPYREYYELLCGQGEVSSVEALALEVVPQLVENFLAWDRTRGARMCLLFASHSSIIPASGLQQLSIAEIMALASWVLHDGDLISKIGMIELGLQVLPGAPDLAPILEAITKQILELDPAAPDGRLNLLMGWFVIAYSELSRTKVIADWPPFRRRFAALTQASLCERHMFARLDISQFADSAIQGWGRRYYLQGLVDLREEPRWLPEYCDPHQLKSELVGRIHNISNRFIDNLPEGSFKELLTGSEPSGLMEHLSLPASFFPGPLEGAEVGAIAEMPKESAESLSNNLSANQLEVSSVIALINLRSVYKIEKDNIEKTIELIRRGQYRFAVEVEADSRNATMTGLASVASVARNPSLADDIRIMFRRIRIDDTNPPSPRLEFFAALIAASAHEEFDDWLKFIGAWGVELAFSVKEKADASSLLEELNVLCAIEPALRKTIGRALSALDAFLRI